MAERALTLVFNPASGPGDGEEDLARLRDIVADEVRIVTTSESEGADALARAAVEAGATGVIAAGGDGTVSAVASVLVGGAVPLGIIPRGTANSFAGALGLPTDPVEAWAVIRAGRTRTVDTAVCSGTPVMLMASVGLKADSVLEADGDIKDHFGILAYVLSGLDKIRRLEQFDVEMEVDGEVVRTTAAAVTVANAAPPWSILAQGPAEVTVDDGLLDVTVLSANGPLAAVAASAHLAGAALTGREAARDDVSSFRAERIIIRTDPPRTIAVDGELCGETPAEIRCVPASLKVFAG